MDDPQVRSTSLSGRPSEGLLIKEFNNAAAHASAKLADGTQLGIKRGKAALACPEATCMLG